MKVCKQCGESKPIDEYYKHTLTFDRRFAKCIKCYLKNQANYKIKNLKKVRRLKREHYHKNIGLKERMLKAGAEKERHRPMKDKLARNSIYYRLQRGILVRPEYCEACKKKAKTDAFLHDKNKRNEIIWLCRGCVQQYYKGTSRLSRHIKSEVNKLIQKLLKETNQ